MSELGTWGGHYDRELKGKKQELVMNCLKLVDK